MKKILIGIMAIGVMAFAGVEPIGEKGVIANGLGFEAISVSYGSAENAELPIVVKLDNGCTVLASAKALSLGKSTYYVHARTTSMTCDKATKNIWGWVYDEQGQFGLNSAMQNTKVVVYIRPDANANTVNLSTSVDTFKVTKKTVPAHTDKSGVLVAEHDIYTAE